MNGRAQDEMLAEECGLDYDEVMADNNIVSAEDFKLCLADFVSKSKWYYITPAGTIDNFIVHSGLSPKSAYTLSKVHTLYRTWKEANQALTEYNSIFTTFRTS